MFFKLLGYLHILPLFLHLTNVCITLILQVKQARLLAVFDFDHTLVDGNTDTWITKLHPCTMQLIREHQQYGWCWTNIMDKVFEVLHSEKFLKNDFVTCLESLKFTAGMKETCNYLQSNSVSTIIISDSNSYFIDHLLERDSLHCTFCSIYTNPAGWRSDGRLHVERFHEHECTVCPLNLCKRKVLQTHLADCAERYESIVYVGDGHGDLCPSLALKPGDYILARDGYKLLKYLKGEKGEEVKADVIPWSSGFEVLQFFQQLCE